MRRNIGNRPRSLIGSCIALVSLVGAACTDQDVEGSSAAASPVAVELDALLEPFDLSDGPGGALGIIHEGELVYARGYGLANLEYAIPNTPETVFRMGSVTKQFAALAMAMLAEDGSIDLDDEIQDYVPEIPRYDQPVTIRHLIHHTSGLRDYNELAALSGRRADLLGTTEATLELLRRQKGLNFPPGSRFLYSNSGYFLMPVIVERVTGMALAEFARARMFDPLGMRDTRFKDDHREVVPNRAYGYVANDDGGWDLYMSQRDFVGAGGVFTTLGDMLKWDRNFYENRIGSSELISTSLTRGTLNDGSELDYAFGLMRGEDRGLPTVEHGGAFAAFTAYMLRYPEQRLTIVTMRNGGASNAGRLARQAADVYLTALMPDLPGRESAASQAPGPSDATADHGRETALSGLGSYAGAYYSTELDATYRIAHTAGNLTLESPGGGTARLRHAGGATFEAQGLTIHLSAPAGSGFLLDGGRVRGIEFARSDR